MSAHFTTETVLTTVYPPFYKLPTNVLWPFHRILERASVSPATYFTLMHEHKIAPVIFGIPTFTHDVPFSLLERLGDCLFGYLSYRTPYSRLFETSTHTLGHTPNHSVKPVWRRLFRLWVPSCHLHFKIRQTGHDMQIAVFT